MERLHLRLDIRMVLGAAIQFRSVAIHPGDSGVRLYTLGAGSQPLPCCQAEEQCGLAVRDRINPAGDQSVKRFCDGSDSLW